MAEFIGDDLSGSRFERVDLSGSRFHAVTLNGVRLRAVEMVDVQISGFVADLRINGVDIMPLFHAELDRRYPERVKMRPTDAAGYREAWDILERLWAGTVERARSMDPVLLHSSVDGEWSFIETLRHLVFATDAWVRRTLLGDPAPWHPLDLPFDEMPDAPGVPRDRAARPSLEEVLELRRDRAGTVRSVLDGLTDESLTAETAPVPAPGWPPPRAFTVSEVLRTILNEEWEHRLYAERDLAVLTGR